MFLRSGLAPLLFTLMAGQAGVCVAPVPRKVSVKIFDYAGTGAEAIAGMSQEAARLFRQAGVTTLWIICPGAAACSQPLRSGEFILRIVPAAPPATLGYAWVMPEGGAYATIFFGRAAALAADSQTPVPRLLGAVAAHELAHLLLGPNSHTHAGLMAANFGAPELRRIEKGWLLFSPAQSKTLRERAARLQATAGHDPPP